MTLPLMYRVRQNFDRPIIGDIPGEIQSQLSGIDIPSRIQPGQSVAITVGSRGIANIPEITRAVVDVVKQCGGVPVIIPAMGSHGGATAAGQQAMLATLGITEASTGAEIRSSMETVIVATTPQGIPVHFDRNAFECDHVIVMGRVKPHTMFVGEIESGLHKMMLIGLGKHAGALTYHRAIKNYSFETIIRAVAEIVLKRCRVLAGLAIVENAYDETALLQAVLPADFYECEKKLLQQANAWMPRLPFREIDLLIVDRIGKNISGTGMDTNVIGRKYSDHEATDRDSVRCTRIFVRGLTKETKGNASGIGLAEFTTRQVVEQIDPDITKVNCVTAGHPTAGMIPLVYENDQAAISDALLTIGMTPAAGPGIVQISDTLHLSELLVSQAFVGEDGSIPGLEILSGPEPLSFDEQGNLPDCAE